MKTIRSYRRRGTPDLPMAVYFGNNRVMAIHTAAEYHPETELVHVIHGHIVTQLDGESKTFRSGDIFLIPSNTVHGYQFISEDAIFCSLTFSPAAIAMQPDHFFQKSFVTPLAEGRLQMPPLLQPGHPAYNVVQAHFETLKNCRIYSRDYQAHRFSGLMGICTALLPYCTVISDTLPAADTDNETIRLCMRYLHNRHREQITLEMLADYCHLHPNYLCALFKKHTGQTIFEYLARYRVETAAQLLKNEDISMSKVAELVGFRSESLFYQNFKKYLGVTPKAYADSQKCK